MRCSLARCMNHPATRDAFTLAMISATRTVRKIVGLYWHFVDLVWIFLFPTLYLL